MNLMKKSFSMLLTLAMIFTTMFSCMTFTSFAADSGTGGEAASTGAKITGFSFENVEGPASGEEGQTISLNVKFDKNIKLLDAEKAAQELNIKIAGGNVSSTSRNVTVSANDDVLNIKMVSTGWVAIYGGTLSVDADSITDIVGADDNQPVQWDAFTTYIPIGITLDNQTKTGTADVAASDTVKITHKANMRGMYHFQLMSNGEPVLPATSAYWYAGAMTSHAHMFNTMVTEKSIASSMANAINNANCGYTAEYTADSDTFTVTANNPKNGEVITVQMLEANSDLRDQKALLNEAKARVDAIEVKTEAANEALSAYDAFNALDESSKTQMAYAKVVNQLLSSIAPAEFDEDAYAELDGSGVVSIDLASLPEGWKDAVKTITVQEDVKDAEEKTYTKDEAGFDIYTGRWGSSVELSSSLFGSSDKRATYIITISADGFEEMSGYIDVKNYGAEKFYIRYIDEKTGKVIKSKAYTMEELKSFSKAQKNAMYQTYCSMAGLRNFCADGVLLEDLMTDAEITGKAGMTVQIRTNDSAAEESGNDSETDNAYYRMGTFKYEDLFSDRYYFPAVFTDEALKTQLSDASAKFAGNGSEATRTALGSSAGKVSVRPMIAWNYDEKVFKNDTSMPSSENYTDRIQNERAFRFLYGIGMESDTVTANETTTWSATYCAFGVDIIDPDYKASSGGSSSSGGGSSSTTVTKYTVNKPADTAEGKVSVSSSTAAKGDTVTITVAPAAGYKTDTVTVTDKDGNKVSVSGSENKYTFKMPGSAATVKVTYAKSENQTETAALPFKDVKTDRWSYAAVKYAYDNKLFSGTSANEFSPAADMTRGMLVTVLYRMEGEPDVSTDAGFTDVKSGDWFAKAVAWAKANNIVSGVSAAEFAPNQKVTREQMAAILYRYAAYKSYSTSAKGDISGFNDSADVSAYAKDAISWAVGEKLVSGTGSNTLAPKGDATREQVAAILQRFAENVAK